jgi:rubrerythrin
MSVHFSGGRAMMTLKEAITTAIDYETRIRDLYRDAVTGTRDPKGRVVFQALAEDEQRHIDYLEAKRTQWYEQGRITVESLASLIPTPELLTANLENLKKTMDREDRTDEKRMLSKALQVEVETSAFYRKLVQEMEGDARTMFARFLEIEDGHIAVVQAELDYISQTGFWFDFQEFDMEY